MLPAKLLVCSWCMTAAAVAGCLSIQDDQVRAKDLSAVAPAFAALPRDTILAPTPVAGVRRILNVSTLQQMVIQLGMDSVFASSICIERASRILDSTQIRRALEAGVAAASGQQDGVAIEILDFSRYRIPEGTLEFSRSGVQAAGEIGAQQAVLWKGRVVYGERRSVAVWARVRLTAIRPALEAIETLGPGKSVQPGQLRAAERRVFAFAKAPLSNADDVAGRVPKRLIHAGEMLQERDLAKRREVEAGDAVAISVGAGELQLKLRGRAESGGSSGENVLVRRAGNGKRIRATVEGPAQVRVESQNSPF